jgi:hypothetical protein
MLEEMFMFAVTTGIFAFLTVVLFGSRVGMYRKRSINKRLTNNNNRMTAPSPTSAPSVNVRYQVLSSPIENEAKVTKSVGSVFTGASRGEQINQKIGNYLLRLFVEGNSQSLSSIRKVIYYLKDPSFSAQRVEASSAANEFSCEIFAYDDFDVDCTIYWKDEADTSTRTLKIELEKRAGFETIKKDSR